MPLVYDICKRCIDETIGWRDQDESLWTEMGIVVCPHGPSDITGSNGNKPSLAINCSTPPYCRYLTEQVIATQTPVDHDLFPELKEFNSE